MLLLKLILFSYFLSFSICLEQNLYNGILNCTNDTIEISGKGIEIFGGNSNITDSGSYLVVGNCTEGTINIIADSVYLYLENLELSSSVTSPITISENLNDIQIIANENVILNNNEEKDITEGSCSVIKIKKNSHVIFKNHQTFTLNGNCKNAIKGSSQASIKFESSIGEYIINSYQNGIVSEGSLIFNGSKFNINTSLGDAIQAKPDENDTISLGIIIVYDGDFIIQSKGDGFQAKNKIEIINGNFNIKTEDGYNSTTFEKETGSSKGFKITNNEKHCQIKVHDGNFFLNTPDDAFHSDGNLTIINGNYKIYSGDDAFHAGSHLRIGSKESIDGPNITILHCYEAIEGASVRIYSGYINASSIDDGINAKKKIKDTIQLNNKLFYLPTNLQKKEKKNQVLLNNDESSTIFISIYGGSINLFSNGNGFNSKGSIYLHGGELNIFTRNETKIGIKHSQKFTLFNSTIICVGPNTDKKIHEEILKGNQYYAFFMDKISDNRILKIKNEKNKTVNEIEINKDTKYIFFSSPNLNEKYSFYLIDEIEQIEEKYKFTIEKLKEGKDDLDIYPDEDYINNDTKDKETENKLESWKIALIVISSIIVFIILALIIYITIRHKC